jgi:signal transduction histidine kinase
MRDCPGCAEHQREGRSKDALIALLEHELRAPLAMAITAAEMLEAEPQESRQILEMLRSSLARENDIIEDLPQFSKMVPGDLRLKRTEVRLEGMIRALAENYRPVWDERKINLEMVFEDCPATLWGDPVLLQTAFKHLLLNAVRFSADGGGVRIEAKSGADCLEVIFSDTGIGIAPEEQSRISDRFYKISENMTRRAGGLGLGLAIVRRIIEAHGGSITVGSRKGGGSRFQVSMPSANHMPADPLRKIIPIHRPAESSPFRSIFAG